jgi:hypothetical protein
MSGVTIFEMDPPDGFGNLQSKIMAVLPELEYQRFLQSCHLEATRIACNPVIVEEQLEARYDPENLTFAVVPAESLGEVDSSASSRVTRLTRAEMEFRSEASRAAYESSRAPNPGGARGDGYSTAAEIGVKTLKLARNSKLARQNAPQDLSLVLEHRAMCEELIGAVFGVPRSMFAQSTYSKSVKNEDSVIMFQRSQMRLKLLLQTFLHRMYYTIYGEHHIREAIARELITGEDEHGDDSGDDEEDEDHRTDRRDKKIEARWNRIEKDASVQITISSIPAPATLTTLYYEGTLSYNAYVDMVSSSYGIPHEFFNRTPGLTLQELNGIKEDNKDISVTDNGEQKQKVTEVEKKSRSATGQVSVTKSRSVETSEPIPTPAPKGGGGAGSSNKTKKNKKPGGGGGGSAASGSNKKRKRS